MTMAATAPRQRDYLNIENPWDARLYRRLRDEICTLDNRNAEGGVPVPTVTELSVWLDCSEGGQTRNIFWRLEKAGLIKVYFFMRTRQIHCLETDKWSASPKNQAVHWRHRSLTIDLLRRHDPGLAIDLQDVADARKMLVCDLLAECVIAGLPVIQSQSEGAKA